MAAPVTLASTADGLYGLGPGEFVAARNDAAKRAKAGGNSELADAIKALPKPSTAAWLVNQLTRRHPEQIDDLIAVGDALRGVPDAATRKELDAQRRALLAAMGRQAQSLARELGHPVGEVIAREAEETLHAGLVDAAAGEALRTGRLVRALSPAGFGEVDLTGAVAGPDGAAPPPAPRPKKTDRAAKNAAAERARAEALEQAWAAAAEAREQLETAAADVTEAETGLGLATAHREQTEAEVEEAIEALRGAREALAEAERNERDATKRRRAADTALETAQRASDRAATALRDLQ